MDDMKLKGGGCHEMGLYFGVSCFFDIRGSDFGGCTAGAAHESTHCLGGSHSTGSGLCHALRCYRECSSVKVLIRRTLSLSPLLSIAMGRDSGGIGSTGPTP